MSPPNTRDPEKRISAASLTPCQVKTDRNFQIACDFRAVQLLKHADISEFHSLAEYYHALMLEGDPSVSRYVPQPFRLKIGRRRYTPDCYLVRNGNVDVVELRPQAEFDEGRRQALEAFFRLHGMRFIVIPNETILSRRTEAENWQMITQMLICHRDVETTQLESQLLDEVARRGCIQFGDYVSPFDRSSSRIQEIALLRLLHQGKLTANLTEGRFGYNTELTP